MKEASDLYILKAIEELDKAPCKSTMIGITDERGTHILKLKRGKKSEAKEGK